MAIITYDEPVKDLAPDHIVAFTPGR